MKKCNIKYDKNKGRGVYAAEPIKVGEIIEICELLLVPVDEVGDTLTRYVFSYDKKFVAVALGNGCLYNHSKKPNANCYYKAKNKFLVFEAIRNIRPGEEVLFNYGYSKEDLKQYNIS